MLGTGHKTQLPSFLRWVVIVNLLALFA